MITTRDYIAEIDNVFSAEAESPWQMTARIESLVMLKIGELPGDFHIRGSVAIHRDAVVEDRVTLKGPVIISANCFVASQCYLRGGVYLAPSVRLGPGCEVKSSLIGSRSALAHFNFAGDSLIGADVNLEAGAIVANHYNERVSKTVNVLVNTKIVSTGIDKFGALIGDGSRIGANAVLSPGTILPPGSVVGRLQLVDQCSQRHSPA